MSEQTESQTRILVVEDNDFVRMQIVKFLQSAEDENYDVIEASDGQIAIDTMTKDIDLAIVCYSCHGRRQS